MVSGEVEHIKHPIREKLNSRLMPIFGFDRLPSLQASNARLTLSRNWIPFIFFAVSLLFINESPIRSLIFPAPLCNVSWGLSVCSVLVGSVSPCRLVLEVRLFPSPPVLFCPLARRWCPFFFPLAFQGLLSFGRVCVCVRVCVDHLNRCKTSFR